MLFIVLKFMIIYKLFILYNDKQNMYVFTNYIAYFEILFFRIVRINHKKIKSNSTNN